MSHHPFDRGITVAEISPMDRPITLPQFSRAAFIGRSLRGPLNTPVLVTSFAAYTRRFGGLWHRSSLGFAVEQFFLNGGREIYIVRVANDAHGALLELPGDAGVLRLRAAEPGSTEVLRAAVDYDGIADEEHFNLIVQRLSPDNGLVVDQEIFTALGLDEDDDAFALDALGGSSLVDVEGPLPAGRPAATMGRGADSRSPYIYPCERGSDGGDLCDYDLIGSAVKQTGLFALNEIDDIAVLYLPLAGLEREPGPTALLAAELYCRKRAAMLVIDPPASWENARRAASGMRHAGFASANIVSYFPRLQGDAGSLPAGGALAGLLCKLDRQDGPWGELDSRRYALHRSLRPLMPVTEEDARLLQRAGINVIGPCPEGGFVLQGGVTQGGGSPSERQYGSLPVRRLCLAIGKSIEAATRWAVFDHDRPHAAARVQAQVKDYMNSLAAAGAFADAPYAVQCEVQRRGPDAVAEHGLTVMLTFQPASADEPLSLTLYQSPSGCRIASTAFAPVAPVSGACA